MNQNKTGIKHLAELCKLKEIENIIISPGSRNAPVILAFQQQAGINCLSITDERSAGFFALGMAQQSKKPVALACTSGTAVLNYAPAVAEAYYQKIPLLIISADRPNEWIDQADSQTIKQKDVFKNYIRKSIELPQAISSDDDLWYTDRLINEAIHTVHIHAMDLFISTFLLPNHYMKAMIKNFQSQKSLIQLFRIN